MAFMGMFMGFMLVVAIVLGTSAFVTAVCFVAAGLVMFFKKRKNKGVKVKAPWYVILLRILGGVAAIPMVLAVCVVVYALIANAADKRTNLARAVMSYDYVQAERILENGADPDIRDEYGRTLLMCIAVHEPYYSAEDENRYELADASGWNDEEDIQMMELLLEYGADIDAAVPDCGEPTAHEYGGETGWNSIYANSDHPCGNTALIYAVRYRSADVIEFLLANGADVNAANDCGFTPLLMCVDIRTDADDGLEITEMLLEEGADPNAVTNFHQDITWLVMRHGNGDNDEISELIDEALW